MILPSHGVYDAETPYPLSINASLAEFQYAEFASGEVATPASPIPAALESGVMDRNGTAVVITLLVLSWPIKEVPEDPTVCEYNLLTQSEIIKAKANFFIINI